jgi:CheY-like chemotaxis protein
MTCPSPRREDTDVPKILLVDDDDLVREIGFRLLHSMGHAVHAACGASEALEILSSGTAFDFLFSDVTMPGGMNGMELAKTARQLHPGLKIVLVTGNIDQHAIRHAELAGGFTILGKPYRRQQLVELFG